MRNEAILVLTNYLSIITDRMDQAPLGLPHFPIPTMSDEGIAMIVQLIVG